MNTFQSMKNNRQSQLKSLTQELEKTQQSNSYEDDRIWKCERDKTGNGFAVIRFLPPSDGETTPWVRMFSHGFQGSGGGWYIENSLTTLNEKDPVSDYNTMLWNNGTESGKEQARKQKRRLNYFSNIYVIEDPAHPENEGKVFLYKFGKKIFDKVNDLMNPEFADEEAINPFDLWGGANFTLKVRMVDGFVNYDKSEFGSSEPLTDDDAKLEEVWNTQYSLTELLEPSNFKTYDELKTKFERVLGLTEDPATRFNPADFETKAEPVIPTAETTTTEGNAEETISYFQKLAAEE